jgi:hypothetical protein
VNHGQAGEARTHRDHIVVSLSLRTHRTPPVMLAVG